uniref:DUF4773 domain-containing protein n=1 Tax=Arion vulgaris TaxID=1028688 RepID=A0A0B6YRA3_9EUPU
MISKACMIIAAVASFSFVSSLDTDNTQMTNGSESLGIKDLVEEIYRQFIADLTVGNNSVCSCTNDCCGCCAHIVIGILHIDETACVNFCYIPAELALDFTFTLNDIVIIEEKISVRNPPPICVGVPIIKLVRICIVFYNIKLEDEHLQGCIDIEAKAFSIVIERLHLGCFRIPPKSEEINEKLLD